MTFGVGGSVLLALISCICTPPLAQAAPPPDRPEHQGAAASASPPPAAVRPVSGEAEGCLKQLTANQVEVQLVSAPPAPLSDCGIAVPIQLTSIGLTNRATLVLPDRPILDCAFGLTFSEFVRDLMAPLAAAMLGSPIVALSTGPGYECRSRNRAAGAKTSAHGKGIAIDLAEVMLNDGRRIGVAHQANATEELFMKTTRQAACGWFTTVLGPGSDPAHAEHFHFDVMRHGSSDNYRICE